MKKIKIIVIAILLMFSISACTTAPITGRKKLDLVDENKLNEEFAVEYSKIISEASKKGLIVNDTKNGKLVSKVGGKITKAVTEYFNNNGMSNKAITYKWEYNLIKSDEQNAWCGPGGKIAFYTGIMPIAKDENGVAAIMAHEIGHAIAGHAAEGASNQTAAGVVLIGKQLADIFTGGATSVISNDTVANGLGLGLLKFNRTQEYEADKYGMIFMAMAGYNPEEAIKVQERLYETSKNQENVPEFFSTHPNGENRIAKLREFLPEAMKYYKK